MKSIFTILLSITTLVYAQQKLKEYSFDMATMQQYPSGWNGFGSAVPLKTKVKITPDKVPDRAGQFFMRKPLETGVWEMNIKVLLNGLDSVIRDRAEMTDIFAVWFTLSDPAKKLKDDKTSQAA